MNIDFRCHNHGEVWFSDTACENALPCEAGVVIQLLHEALDLIGETPRKTTIFLGEIR